MQILLFGLTNADVAQRVAELETAVAQVMIVTAEVLARAITGVWEDPGSVAQARSDFEKNIASAGP